MCHPTHNTAQHSTAKTNKSRQVAILPTDFEIPLLTGASVWAGHKLTRLKDQSGQVRELRRSGAQAAARLEAATRVCPNSPFLPKTAEAIPLVKHNKKFNPFIPNQTSFKLNEILVAGVDKNGKLVGFFKAPKGMVQYLSKNQESAELRQARNKLFFDKILSIMLGGSSIFLADFAMKTQRRGPV